MRDKEQRDKINSLLTSELNCDIATVSEDGWPQSATISFYANEKFEIIFGTWWHTRKYNNLEYNDRVSMVFGFASGLNIQYEGVAVAIEADNEDVQAYLAKKPSARAKLQDETWAWFRVSPVWLRYSDFRAHTPKQFEVIFEDEEIL